MEDLNNMSCRVDEGKATPWTEVLDEPSPQIEKSTQTRLHLSIFELAAAASWKEQATNNYL